MSKIGIGVITVGKRPLPDYRLREGDLFEVFNDTERKGAAYGRNFLMNKFYEEGCDYWFIFDDDVHPTMDGWQDYFVNQAKEGWDFFGMPEYFKDPIVGGNGGEILSFERCLVQFALYSRKLVETAGFYRRFTNAYGFEDTEYVYRIQELQKAGLLNQGIYGFPCPVRVMAYIHPDDVFGNNPTPYINMTKEAKEFGVGQNVDEYHKSLEDVRNGKVYWSYAEAQGI